MRDELLIGVALSLTFATGCTSSAGSLGGDTAASGSSSDSASPTSLSASSASTTGSGGPSAPATSTADPGAAASEIRRTDWPNAVIGNLSFCGESDDSVAFRNGSNGFDVPCRILPDGAQPVYAEFIVEEPANAPSTEDALVLVELGNPNAARRQALVPVQLSDNGSGRYAWPVILGDESSASGDRVMTFISYQVVGQHVEATVRKLDGSTENRRWRKYNGSGNWERY
ncbi:hypothetical protein [Micromonospora luteifusca]|uniref:hypothetical protein n=1 Tax=Micromonospora luteifusca TaxID=709860 RepID=UPI0033A9A9F9